ncbi:hypothetical protein BX591_11028 [Paraburkholderia bryophila]|uniref:Uncharacterized protein n=1 Tax=Paraburkholderia bryophila TaxID=420952 RepID=A0A329C4M8_9BURK|nr:hypothetical protein BX591_11028 [Paraburkholderia bryophila]
MPMAGHWQNDGDCENNSGYSPEGHDGAAEPIDEPVDIFP